MHEKENDNISANGGNVTRASDASKLGEVNISIVYIYADEFRYLDMYAIWTYLIKSLLMYLLSYETWE